MKNSILFLFASFLFFFSCETAQNDKEEETEDIGTGQKSQNFTYEVIKAKDADDMGLSSANVKIINEDGSLAQEIELIKKEDAEIGTMGFVEGDKSVTFADYNFDGKADVSIATGKAGNSMGNSYSIYLQNEDGSFELNEAISKLSVGTYLEIEDGKLKTNGRSSGEVTEDVFYNVVDNTPVAIED